MFVDENMPLQKKETYVDELMPLSEFVLDRLSRTKPPITQSSPTSQERQEFTEVKEKILPTGDVFTGKTCFGSSDNLIVPCSSSNQRGFPGRKSRKNHHYVSKTKTIKKRDKKTKERNLKKNKVQKRHLQRRKVRFTDRNDLTKINDGRKLNNSYVQCSKENNTSYVDIPQTRRKRYKKTIPDGFKVISTLFVVIICLSVVNGDAMVVVDLISQPFIFGADMSLQCTVKETECRSSIRWTKGEAHDIVSLNGVSANASKYSSERVKCQSNLTIQNPDISDINITYSCLYLFYEESFHLKLDENHFARLPEEETIKFVQYVQHEITVVDVTLTDVFPEPECKFSLNVNDTILSSFSMKSKRLGLFYQVMFQVNVGISGSQCNGTLSMDCNFRSLKKTINRDVKDICISYRNTAKEEKNYLYIMIGPTAGLIILVIVTIFELRRRKIDYFKTKKKNFKEKKDLLQNQNTEEKLVSTSV